MLVNAFTKITEMSLMTSVAVIIVLLLRIWLKRAPKVFSYALWGIVLFRLLCPVAVQSDFSFFGMVDVPYRASSILTAPAEYLPSNTPQEQYPALVPANNITAEIGKTPLPQSEEAANADKKAALLNIAAYIWLGGVLIMAAYAAFAYRRLRRRLITASLLKDNIYLADEIISPFVLGLGRPKIYLPSSLGEQEQAYIIMHEKYHIKRRDHLWKALAFAALCLHWFNPLGWVAFIQAGKDMETSCDEAVIKQMGIGIMADYAASLLSLATGRKIVAGMPLAFGEGDTKERIRNLAKWRRPTFWVIAAAVIIGLNVGASKRKFGSRVKLNAFFG